ncbi:MAG: NAD-dependent epimerase/dehydratase family protein [Brevundimonas aurantiaca]|uniref:NAD-dependent epimerase/dehydratase family protein n=1 Tax=Brevundimonas aurantiaca TaxID=74316 RepID=UPI00391A01F5
MTTCLVTGAAGFLGFHLARALSAREGFEVICVDNFARGENDAHYDALTARPNVKRLDIDLTDPSACDALPDADYVYHLAALNGTQNFYERPMAVIKGCTLPTIYLAERYGRSPQMKRFVYAGTSESYASTVTRFGWPVPTGEDVPLGLDDVMNPRWSYAGSKMHGEVVTAQAGRTYGFPFSIIRYHNAYGPRMGDKHVVPDFYARMREGRYELFGYEDTRSFLYVDDSVRATIMVAEADAAAGEIINIGGAEEITMLELGQRMLRQEGVAEDITLHPSPAGSVKRRAPDVSKLKHLTGFNERISMADGLKATSDFYLRDELADALNPLNEYKV